MLGLKTGYLGTQDAETVATLVNGPNIKLVTLNIGGNDLVLIQQACLPPVPNFAACILGKLPAALTAYGKNLTRILTRIRVDGGYRGKLVLMTQFSPDYRDPIQTGGIAALNIVMRSVAAAFNAEAAEGFAAFALASASRGAMFVRRGCWSPTRRARLPPATSIPQRKARRSWRTWFCGSSNSPAVVIVRVVCATSFFLLWLRY